MAASISRRLTFNLLKKHHPINPNRSPLTPISSLHSQNPNLIPSNFTNPPPKPLNSYLTSINFFKPQQFQTPNFFSTSTPPQNPTRSSYPSQNLGFKHQEITGSTVDRDESASAKETRQRIESMIKKINNLSISLVLLTLIQLGWGAWALYGLQSSPISEVYIPSLMPYALPFMVVYMLLG